jgi:monoamine oxidase
VAGLYAALLLQRAGYLVHIFESTDRVGGRIHTHYFNDEENQYFEAGAMRIPHSPHHGIVFDLIKYLQRSKLPSDLQLDLIPYNLTSPGNFVYINRSTPKHLDASSTTPRSINWPLLEGAKAKFQDRSAEGLMLEAVSPLLKKLEGNFIDGFNEICREFDHYSFRFYLTSILGWPTEVIDFIETVTSQTNQFSLSVTEIIMEYIDFSTKEWSTIARGMSRLPLAMAHLIGHKNITFNARVTGIRNKDDGRVSLSISGRNASVDVTFDKVIIAIPPPALRMISNRPAWSGRKELAIRSMHFESLYKMGLRFKTRFWERVGPVPCRGGQSTTDLPIRWIVYPSNGIGDDGPGVLLVYSWMTDADAWSPLTPEERRDLALANLAEVYNGRIDTKDGSVINVYDLIMATSDAVWSARNSTGDAKFLPGQFLSRFEAARQPEGNIYFAGEHLSRHHTWIAGAVESALETICNIIGPTPKLAPTDVHSSSSFAKAEDQVGGGVIKRHVLEVANWESTISTGGHFGERGNIDLVLRLRKQLFGFDLDNDQSGRSGVEIARIPGPQGVKVRRI